MDPFLCTTDCIRLDTAYHDRVTLLRAGCDRLGNIQHVT